VVKIWIDALVDNDIPISGDFTLAKVLSTEKEVSLWQRANLPGDEFSTENAINITNTIIPPLIIDP
jgi:hypothetical protein